MVDVNVLVGEYLAAQSSVTSLLGTNAGGSIYYGYDLPEHFDPSLGPAIQLFRAGGSSHTEITVLVDARLQIRVWDDAEDPGTAAQVYSAIHDVLHGLCGQALADGTIVRALEITGPQEMTDPDTGWVAVFAFYKVMARPSSGGGTGPSGGSSTVTRYNFTPAPDGVTTVFNAPVNISANALVVREGLILTAGDDYSYSGTEVTFFVAPDADDVIALYQ